MHTYDNAIDPNYYASNQYIAFRHDGSSEDFIGYKNNTFFFKDAPAGIANDDDIYEPKVQIGEDISLDGENGSAYLGGNLTTLGGIRLHNFTGAVDPNYYADNQFIAFREAGVSEDFIGYRNHTFYFKDAPSGGEAHQPRVVIGSGYLADPFAGDLGGYLLFVSQGIRTEKVKVDIAANNGWADFVFAPDYELMPLAEVEAFIKENQHLPEVPSAKELEENGMDLAEMDKIQMQKIEELTLYTLEQQQEIQSLKAENEMLKNQLQNFEQRLTELENK